VSLAAGALGVLAVGARAVTLPLCVSKCWIRVWMSGVPAPTHVEATTSALQGESTRSGKGCVRDQRARGEQGKMETWVICKCWCHEP